MRYPAALVVAAWGGLNLALMATLAGFGGSSTVLALYGGAAALIELVAVAVWIAQRRRSGRPTWRQAPHGDSILIFAGGVLIFGLALAFQPFLALLSLPSFVVALLREATLRRGNT